MRYTQEVKEIERLKIINAELLEALKNMKNTHGMHGPCEQNSCSSCDIAYRKAGQAIKKATE